MHDRPHKAHADRIVKQFREEVGAKISAEVSDQDFDGLSVMIESALNTAVMDALNATVAEIQLLAEQTRKRAAGEL